MKYIFFSSFIDQTINCLVCLEPTPIYDSINSKCVSVDGCPLGYITDNSTHKCITCKSLDKYYFQGKCEDKIIFDETLNIFTYLADSNTNILLPCGIENQMFIDRESKQCLDKCPVSLGVDITKYECINCEKLSKARSEDGK